MKFKVATIEKDGVSDGTLKVGPLPVVVLVAIIGIIPPITGKLFDLAVMSKAQEASNELESSKLDLERDRDAVSLFRQALSDPDSAQRKRMLEFIVAADLLSPEIDTEALLREEVPQWPVGPEESP